MRQAIWRISTAPGERPLVDLLREGALDAVFTPFMPVGFFEPGSGLRTLQSDCRAAEVAYFKEVGYMPGIHLLGLKPAIVAEALDELLERQAERGVEHAIVRGGEHADFPARHTLLHAHRALQRGGRKAIADFERKLKRKRKSSEDDSIPRKRARCL